jgi:hypothetical protein
LVGGKITGTWGYKKLGKKLLVTITPFGEGWYKVNDEDDDVSNNNKKKEMEALLKERAKELAAYFGMPDYEVAFCSMEQEREKKAKEEEKKKKDGKPPCFYGAKCKKQDDADHIKEFSHPSASKEKKTPTTNKKRKKSAA